MPYGTSYGIQEVRGSIPLSSTKKFQGVRADVLAPFLMSALVLSTLYPHLKMNFQLEEYPPWL